MTENKIPYIDFHTHKNDPTGHVQIFCECPGITERKKDLSGLYTFGFHPWRAGVEQIPDMEKRFFHEIKNPDLLSFGEMGLDKACKTDYGIQRQVFMAQLEILKKMRQPTVILHCVKSFQEIFKCFKEAGLSITPVFHDFNGDYRELRKQADLYVSLGSALFKANSTLRKKLADIPLERIFFETDDSERAIEDVYAEYASAQQVELQGLKVKIAENFRCLFKNKKL